MAPTITALHTVTYLGLAQNLALKTAKYNFLDVAREKSYIPLSTEEKTIGKAAVDVLGSRIGKAGGGLLISTFLIPIFGGDVSLASWQQIDNITPYIALIYAICVALMLFATIKLIPLYDAKDYEKNS